MDGGVKGRGSVIRPTRGPLQLFSRGCAYGELDYQGWVRLKVGLGSGWGGGGR